MSDENLDYQSPSGEDATSGAAVRGAAGAMVDTSTDLPCAIKGVLRQPPVLIVVMVLLVAAIGLNASVGMLRLHFKKEAVPLAHPLGTIAPQLGNWVQVSQDQPLDKEMLDVLGTEAYVFRDYVDERVVGKQIAEQFKDKSNSERQQLYSQIRARNPEAAVTLSVTYYTGMVDTVAHVPDRCVTADGYEPKPGENGTEVWPIAAGLPAEQKKGTDNVTVRYINFEDQTNNASNVTRSISYVFHTNGEFVASPLGVRQKLADLWVKRGYYAKIETLTLIKDSAESARVMTDFLTAALPEIRKCLPDWDKVNGASPQQVASK